MPKKSKKKTKNSVLKSFRPVRRRDYVTSWKLPGFWKFSIEVFNVLYKNKKLFLKFVALYALVSFVVVGLLSQESFKLLDSSVNQLGGNAVAGELSGFVQNAAVFAGVLTGAFTQPLSETQQLYMSLLFIFSWLSIVWTLRQLLAGQKNLKLRDALYNAGAPFVSTLVLSFILLVQLIPMTIAALGYGAALETGVFNDTLMTVLFWCVALLFVVASLYWVTSTLIGLVIVTLPGMYPVKALKSAGKLVVGRRLKILYRYSWMVLNIVTVWAVIVIPAIIISRVSWLAWLPIVPIVVLLLTSASVVYSSAYIYLLYRKLVDGEKSTA